MFLSAKARDDNLKQFTLIIEHNLQYVLIHNLQNKQFMILVEDDIHFIHAKQ